jgi:hypothetical protein
MHWMVLHRPVELAALTRHFRPLVIEKFALQFISIQLEWAYAAAQGVSGGNGQMRAIAKYRWSLSSIAVTVGTALVTLAAIQYLYRHDLWRPQSRLGGEIDGTGGLAVLISFVLAVVALFKKEPPFAALLALFLSMFSFLLYVR